MRYRLMTVAAGLMLAGALAAPAANAAGTPTGRSPGHPSLEPGRAPATSSISITELCGNGGSGYCLNDWNNGGNNNPINMYYGGYANNAFGIYQLIAMCNHGKVEILPGGGCPFAVGSGLNSKLNGAPIYAIAYNNDPGYCLGTGNTDPNAILTPCPSSSGTGGGWGTIFVLAGTPGVCSSSHQFYFTSVHWSFLDGELAALQSGGNPGVQAFVTSFGPASTCWGYVQT